MTTARDNLIQSLEDYLEFLNGNSGTVSTTTTESTSETLYWVFLVPIEDIFNRVKMITALKARNKRDQKTGASLFDVYAVTADERDKLERTIENVSLEVYKKICHLSKDLAVPFLYDQGPTITTYSGAEAYVTDDYVYYGSENTIYRCIDDITGLAPDATGWENYWVEEPETVDTLNKVVITIINRDGFDQTLIENMDNMIEECIVYGIITEWYKFIGDQDEYRNSLMEYDELIGKLRMLSFHQNTAKTRKLYGL